MTETLKNSEPRELGLLDVADANRLNQRLLMGDIDSNSAGLRRMTGKIFEIMDESLDGFAGGLGLGFPYHSMDEDGNTIPNPEFARYTGELAVDLESEIASETGWPCVTCQKGSNFHPSNCKSCLLTPLKPRHIMKALPDIDTVIVMDEVTPEVLDSVWGLAEERGFTQSDFSIADSISRVHSVLKDFEYGAEPEIFLPVDLHVIAKNDFIQACQKVGSGETDVNARIWSMYAEWKLNEDIDFWFDFVFSATPYSDTMQSGLYQAIIDSRQQLSSRLSSKEIENTVISKSPRASRLLGNGATRASFGKKLEHWRV